MVEGRVMCWGFHTFYDDGTACQDLRTMSHHPLPVSIPGVSAGDVPVVQVFQSADYVCALNVAGGVRCWHWWARPTPGAEPHPQLGCWSRPKIVDGAGASVIRIAVGGVVGTECACAVSKYGTVRCWGSKLDENGYDTEWSVPWDLPLKPNPDKP